MNLKKRSIFGLILIATIIINVAVHIQASYSFPIPWPDESHFLWQSIAFQETNTFYSPVLNPDRAIFWMPPGYFIAMGSIFKISGASLSIARTTSLVMVLVAFLLLSAILYRQRLPLISLFIAGLFFINCHFIMGGNVARMEPLLLVIIFASFLLLMKGRFWKGLLLLCISPLIHFNGVYFIGAYILTTLLSKEIKATIARPSRSDIIMFVLVMLMWLGYGLYVLNNWAYFYHDMSYQFSRKSSRDMTGFLFAKESILFLALTILCLIYAVYKQLSFIPLVVIALMSWITYKIGHEMWYEVFKSIAFLFLTISVIHIAYHLTAQSFTGKRKIIKLIIPAIAGIALLLWAYQNKLIEDMVHYPAKMNKQTMSLPDNVPYITADDIQRIKNALDTIPEQNKPLYLQFQPRSDAFFFLDIDTVRFRFLDPTFCERKPDIYILHSSRYLPDWWLRQCRKDLLAARVSYKQKEFMLFSRNQTEKWFFHSTVTGNK